MMFLFVVLGVLAGYLLGGRLQNFSLCFKWWLLPVVAFLAEWLLPKIAVLPAFLPQAALYGLLLLFFLKNRKGGAWVALAGAGTLLNGLVIALNGWRMPIAPFAVRHFPQLTARLSLCAVPGYALASEGTRLAFLGDIIPVLPGGPLLGLASVGDFIMGLGILLLIVRAMGAKAPDFRVGSVKNK